MSKIKNSSILNRVMKKARKMAMCDSERLTTEYFLAALVYELVEFEKANIEFSGAKSILEVNGFDVIKSYEALLAYVGESREPVADSAEYLQSKINETEKWAVEHKLDAIPLDSLLVHIMEDLNPAIKDILVCRDPDDDWLFEDELEDEIDELFDEFDEDVEYEADDCKREIDALIASVKSIRKELQANIFGQDNAINMFVTGYFRANLMSLMKMTGNRPKATFLFAGPPGVGKTFLAEKAAEQLNLPFARFDMSEYSNKESDIEFCGSDKVYKNGKVGNVTSFVAEHPECVLLFDEVEKAHMCVIHLFLQMLDAGRLRDNYTDEEVSFSNAVIILTTNAGKQLYEEVEGDDLSSVSRKVIIRALQNDINPQTDIPFFPAAICSRFASGNVVMFNHITAHNLVSIASNEIKRHASEFENKAAIKMNFDDEVYTALLFAEGGKADARTVRGRAEAFFNDELYELLRLISSEKVKTCISDIETINVTVDLLNCSKTVRSLFEYTEGSKVLVFADAPIVEMCRNEMDFCVVMGAQEPDEAVNIIKNNCISFVLLDICCGMHENDGARLNIEDADSKARDFRKILREHGNGLPLYLLENSGYSMSDEEKISFSRQGVRGFLRLGTVEESFASQTRTILMALHQQANMVKLAGENKIVSFGTSQAVSDDGKTAVIKLYDFEMAVAVDSEDAKNILSDVSKPNVRFDDIIGAGEAKEELAYFVEYLKNPHKYMGTGVKAPRGVLLYGSPGTGKTMLAKAMASETGLTFIAAEGNQFINRYNGEGAKKVHELFKTARKYAPSILFIDEIDAIAGERGGDSSAGRNYDGTLTAFLTEMDGFSTDPGKPVFVLAATNFDVEPGGRKSLDMALVRRFDRSIYIELPDKNERMGFIQMKIANTPSLKISCVQTESIALRSTGMSLADLDSIIELSLRLAIRKGAAEVTDTIFEEAFEAFGNEGVKKWEASQLERVAIHEAGHALISFLNGETPPYLTVITRKKHGRYMQSAYREEKAIYTYDELLSEIRAFLGGRAAEIVCYGKHNGASTEAGADLAAATNLARKIVCLYGMDDDFGMAVVPETINGIMSAEVRNAVNEILKTQLNEAIRLISDNIEKIDALAECLMEKNHLNGAEIEKTLS